MSGRSSARRPVAWQSMMQHGWQNGIDTAAELSDALANRLSAMADPRAKLLRKRKWALRLGLLFTAACGFWMLATAVLATWSTPFWVLLITGLIAGGAAFLATLLLLRYRWLRGVPLPAPRSRATWRLPPRRSAARRSMATLASSERGLFSLLGVMERGRMLPPDELRELAAAANHTATTMAATANDVVSMERTIASAPQSRGYLGPTVTAFAAQLDSGARQYGELVTAAAQLVSAANSGSMSSSPMVQRRYRDELVSATDRLTGWAQAFDELGRLRRA